MNWHLDVSSTEEREKILKDTAALGPWYQSFNLADWLKIQAVHDGDSVLDCMDRLGFPRDFSDKTVLDVGCNAGFYSFVAKSRGRRTRRGRGTRPSFRAASAVHVDPAGAGRAVLA